MAANFIFGDYTEFLLFDIYVDAVGFFE